MTLLIKLETTRSLQSCLLWYVSNTRRRCRRRHITPLFSFSILIIDSGVFSL